MFHYDKALALHEFCKERIRDAINGYDYEVSFWKGQGKDDTTAHKLSSVGLVRWIERETRIPFDERASVYRIYDYFELWKLGFPNQLVEIYGSDLGNDGI